MSEVIRYKDIFYWPICSDSTLIVGSIESGALVCKFMCTCIEGGGWVGGQDFEMCVKCKCKNLENDVL